jgi:hypothetical protein
VTEVQRRPSQSQVTSGLSAPPKSTTRCVAGSSAILTPELATGPVGMGVGIGLIVAVGVLEAGGTTVL